MKRLIPGALAAAALCASAQEIEYSGRASLAASYTRGNVKDERIHADGELTARTADWRTTVSALLDRREERDAEASTSWRAGANHDRFLAPTRFVYARASVEHDRAKDVDRRSTAGVGYGAELLSPPPASLSVRTGLDYVDVKRFHAADESYPALGWGVKLEYAPFFHEHEGFWNLEDSESVLVRSKSGVRVPITGTLSASAQLVVDWERRPAPGRRSTDSTLVFGLDYTW